MFYRKMDLLRRVPLPLRCRDRLRTLRKIVKKEDGYEGV